MEYEISVGFFPFFPFFSLFFITITPVKSFGRTKTKEKQTQKLLIRKQFK